ncbi:MAG: SLC13 family permease [Myxococcales bacterium]|nr:SLC13 family permease [Myxococcales bacterium]
MGLDAWITVAVLVGVFALLVTDRYPAEGVLMGALAVLLATGVSTPATAFAGFSSPAVLALAGLYVLTGALRETGALDRPAQRLLAGVASVAHARRRLMLVTTPISAFLNNTPIVAMFMPIASTWARRRGQSPHGLLLPLSYAAVLGGTCTLLGTATHLVVDGALVARGMPGLGLFELTPIGLPVVAVGLPLTVLLAGRLLRAGAPDPHADPDATRREYTSDLRVVADSPLVGATIEDAGLRHLPGLFLVRIERDGNVIAPVTPGERLEAGDRLTFAGVLETIVDVQRRRGLAPADAEPSDAEWVLHEAVISRGSPLVGTTIREAHFRGAFNAAVVAVHRHGDPVEGKLGDIKLRHGDTLLLQAAPGFARTFRDSTDFYLISEVSDATRPRHARAPIAALLLLGTIALIATRTLPLATAAVVGAVLAVVTGCLSFGAARRAVDISVLIVVAAALGLARAVEDTGIAAAIAAELAAIGLSLGPVALLAMIYATGMLLTELITNTAAAALLLPIAIAVAAQAGVDPRPFVLATSISASISLATPLGYQTNMMVYGPGGYRFVDFVKMGVPVQLACGVAAVTALALLYPL